MDNYILALWISLIFRFFQRALTQLISMANLLQFARLTFLLALLILHTILFAKPSIEQYLEVKGCSQFTYILLHPSDPFLVKDCQFFGTYTTSKNLRDLVYTASISKVIQHCNLRWIPGSRQCGRIYRRFQKYPSSNGKKSILFANQKRKKSTYG